MPIRFFSDGIVFKVKSPKNVKSWIIESAIFEKRQIMDLNYIFCSDSFLLDLNQRFLNHDTLTDIITFDHSESPRHISGEIYISIDRVRENATKFDSEFNDELLRVMIHGVLHLCGYLDKKRHDKILMRKKESTYLSLWRKKFHVKPKG